MNRPTVVVTAPIHQAGLELLRDTCDVREVHHPVVGYEPMAAAVRDADAVVVRSAPLPGDLLRASPRLKVIGKHGAGLDSVDVAAAAELGIVVATSGDANSASVAEHAVMLMLATLRRVVVLDALTRAGGYAERETLAFGDLSGSTVGLVGFGNIGRTVARMCGQGFGTTVLAHDPGVPDAVLRDAGATPAGLDELLTRADVVSLHLPLTERTRHLIGDAQLRRMKPGAILVNTSRGGVVDEAALADALAEEGIRGAGLDVFEQEPPSPDDPLFALSSVVVSPHVGGGSEGARRRTAIRSAQAVLDVLREAA